MQTHLPVVDPRTISVRHPFVDGDPVSYPRNANRPRTRGECANGPRPCPFVSCAHHLFLDVTSAGSIKLNYGADTLDGLVENLEGMRETCALDVADKGGTTLEEVGALMNVTRERIRQMEEKVLTRLRESKSVRKSFGEESDEEMVPPPPPAPPDDFFAA